MRKIPMRKCVATQEQCPKKELIRIVRTPEPVSYTHLVILASSSSSPCRLF